MKNQIRNYRPPYLFAQQVHGKDPVNKWELVIPHFKPKRGKDMFKNILRWEDDGGKILEVNSSMLEQMFVRPVRPVNQSTFQHTPEKGEPHA